MKQFKCGKCSSTEVFISKSGNNTGLYCSDCGKWIQWLNKDEIRLAERQINEIKITNVPVNNKSHNKYCGVKITSSIIFNENDTRDYKDIVDEIENAIFKVLDKRGHTLLCGTGKGIAVEDL